MDFGGKVCLVTGGANGIGRAFVEKFLSLECKCLIVDVQHAAGEQLCVDLKRRYGDDNVAFMRVDVASFNNLEAAFEKCYDVFSSNVDVVVNNAGVDGEINWEAQMQINLMGTIKGTQLAIKYMGKGGYGSSRLSSQRGGVVLNISSVQGLASWPAMPVYSAGKAAIVQYTRCLGHELEYANHGVKIVCLCPNGVDSGMMGFHPYVGMTRTGADFIKSLNIADRILTPQDCADAGVRLIDEARTGSVWYLHKHGDRPVDVPVSFENYEDLLKLQNV